MLVASKGTRALGHKCHFLWLWESVVCRHWIQPGELSTEEINQNRTMALSENQFP